MTGFVSIWCSSAWQSQNVNGLSQAGARALAEGRRFRRERRKCDPALLNPGECVGRVDVLGSLCNKFELLVLSACGAIGG